MRKLTITPDRRGRDRDQKHLLPFRTGRSTGWLRGLVPLLACAPLLQLGSCVSQTPAGTFFGSDPPGALVYVDDAESGYVTPCNIHLSEGDDYTVRIELPGYQPAVFELESAIRFDFVPWTHGTNFNSGLTAPFFLGWYDFFAPIRTNRALSPSRIFVRLVPSE